MSLDIAGVGGLLSGVFAHSFRRAMIWAVGFGAMSIIIGWMVRDVPHFAPGFVFLIIAAFWGLVGWSVKYLALRLSVKVATRGSGKN